MMNDDIKPSSPQTDEIATFWQNFLTRLPEWNALPVPDRVGAINDWVQPQWGEIAFELLGDNAEGPATLVLTAQGMVDYFPTLIALASGAPALPNLDVVAFRQRLEEPSFTMGMDGFNLSVSNVLVGIRRDGPRAALEMAFNKPIDETMTDHACNMAIIMLDHVVGEYDSVIKICDVQFVDTISPELGEPISLEHLAPALDAFWRDDLGHSGIYPTGEHSWQGMEVAFRYDDEAEREDDATTAVISLNLSANLVAMRADLSTAITVIAPATSQSELTAAQTLEDRLEHLFSLDQSSIIAYSMLYQGQRHLVFYTGDVTTATERVNEQLRNLHIKNTSINVEPDFCWDDYYRFTN